MAFWDDDRGQAIQIGAVLLFAVLVIAFSLYQAFVVPNQNQQVEANHLGTVERDMIDLRDGIVSVPKTGDGRSVEVSLGTNYPARAIALNPPPASGSLRTVGTTDDLINVTLAHARALDGETADYWNGTNRTRGTGGVIYEPNYNEFRDPPDIIYDTTTVISRFDDASLETTGQTFIDGRQLTLVALEGTYDRSSSRSVSLDVEALSASTTDVAITNETGENVTIQFASQRNASGWRSLLLEEQQFTNQSGNVVDVAGSYHPDPSHDLVTVELRGNETYDLRMAKVGVGTGTVSESARYITDVVGDGVTIQEESNQTLIVEARDKFNNPISGVELSASVETGPENGSLVNTTVRTNEDGSAKFRYSSDDISGESSRKIRINVSLDGQPSATFNPRTPENVSMTVSVQNTDGSGLGGGSGSGAYAVNWLNPNDQTPIDCPDGPNEVCTFDASQSTTATLTMNTTPVAQQANVEYAVNDTSVLSLSRTTGNTDENGENSTTVLATDDGFANVYTSSGSSGDTLVLEVTNTVTGLTYNDDAVAVDGNDDPSPDNDGGVEFTVSNDYSSDVTIDSITIDPVSDDIVELSDELSNSPDPQNVEAYIDADTDAYSDYGGGVSIPDNGLTVDVGEDGDYNSGNRAVVNAGNIATISFYEFYSQPGQSGNVKNHDMSGEQLKITISYTVDGVQTTTEFTITAQ